MPESYKAIVLQIALPAPSAQKSIRAILGLIVISSVNSSPYPKFAFA